MENTQSARCRRSQTGLHVVQYPGTRCLGACRCCCSTRQNIFGVDITKARELKDVSVPRFLCPSTGGSSSSIRGGNGRASPSPSPPSAASSMSPMDMRTGAGGFPRQVHTYLDGERAEDVKAVRGATDSFTAYNFVHTVEGTLISYNWAVLFFR